MREREQGSREGLSGHERDYLLGRTPVESRIERRRPGWMVVGMVWATFGIYILFWVGLNWAELKRQLQRDNMYPIPHGLSMLVPIYSYYQYYMNFRVMNELLESSKVTQRTQPGIVIATFLLASLLAAVPIQDLVLMTLNLTAAIGAISWTLHHGQSAMNEYWDATPGVQTTSEVKLWERLIIAAGAGLWSLIIFGMFAEMAAA